MHLSDLWSTSRAHALCQRGGAAGFLSRGSPGQSKVCPDGFLDDVDEHVGFMNEEPLCRLTSSCGSPRPPASLTALPTCSHAAAGPPRDTPARALSTSPEPAGRGLRYRVDLVSADLPGPVGDVPRSLSSRLEPRLPCTSTGASGMVTRVASEPRFQNEIGPSGRRSSRRTGVGTLALSRSSAARVSRR